MIAVIAASVLSLAGCTSERTENEYAYRQIGINYMNDGEYASAVEAFDNALSQKIGKISELELDICYYKALAQYSSGDARSAIETYTAIIDYKDKLPDAYYLRGCVYAAEGDTKKALEDFESAIERADSGTDEASGLNDEYEMYVKAIESLEAAGDEESASKLVSALSEKVADAGEKGDSVKMYYKGVADYLMGDYDNAASELGAAGVDGPAKAFLYLGKISVSEKKLADAKESFDTYIDNNPLDVEGLSEIGASLMDGGYYDAAVNYYRQGLDVAEGAKSGDDSSEDKASSSSGAVREMKRNLVAALEYSGEFDEAFETATEYMEAYPSDDEMERELTFLETRRSDDDSDSGKSSGD